MNYGMPYKGSKNKIEEKMIFNSNCLEVLKSLENKVDLICTDPPYKTKNIPKDYPGLMGVPITFMDKFNAEQFRLISVLRSLTLNGKVTFVRIIIQNLKLRCL